MSANFGGSTGDNLQVTSGVSLSFTHSVSLWVKPDVNRNWSAAISFGNAANDSHYARLLITSTGGVLLQILGTGGLVNFTHSTTISTGTWTHLAYTATNSSFYSYVNGTASSQNTTAVTGFGTAVSKLTIGAYSALSTLYPFDGRIAEVGVYNGTVLSGAQISALAGGDKPDTIGSCTHYYLPIDDAGTWTDNVGALDLTKSGTVTNDDADHPAMNAGGGGYTLTADAGSYSLSGSTASLLAGRKITASSGSYTQTGNTVGLYANRALAATTGSYTLTGNSVTLTYTPTGAYTLTAEPGSYTLTGVNAALTANRVLAASKGTYSLTGVDAGLNFGYTLTASSGSYALTGKDATLTVARLLSADTGVYALTGYDVDLSTAIKSISCTLVNRNGATLGGLSSISWAWFDDSDPVGFSAPSDSGQIETTDGSGLIDIPIPNSTLTTGQTGTLVLRSNDGLTLGAYNLEVA